MKTRMLIFLLVLCLMPMVCLAEMPAQITSDFEEISGYVVMPIGEEFLIDLDASNGIAEGDIFTVVQSGEKVIHPVTHEVIGTLDDIKGFLRVTRVKSGYSYAALVKPAEGGIQKGDEITRYYQVPSQFRGDSVEHGPMLSELKKSLPQLRWLSATASEEPLLVFQRDARGLSVVSATGETLFTYPLAQEAPPISRQKAAVAIPVPTVSAPPIASMPPAAVVQPQTSDVGGVWHSQPLDAAAVAMAVADFDGDGQQEIALVLGKNLKIMRNVQGQLTELFSFAIAAGTIPLSIDSLDLDSNGKSEIFLTTIKKDKTIDSRVIEFAQGHYQTTINKVPWFLRVVDLPGEGPVLLGQRKGEEEKPFAESLFRVQRNGNQLLQGQSLALPTHVGIYGFVPFADDKGQTLYAYLTETDYLKVVSETGSELWESPDHFGGSEVRFQTLPDASNDDPLTIYVKPRILFLQANQLIVPQNEGFRTLQGYRKFQKSRVIALQWNGLALNEFWKTADQGGYLNDLALADMDNDGQVELLTFVKFKHKGLFQKARSALVAYELN